MVAPTMIRGLSGWTAMSAVPMKPRAGASSSLLMRTAEVSRSILASCSWNVACL